MFLQLQNGRTIELSLEQYLDLSDEDIQELISYGYNYTFDTTNPFHKSFNGNTNDHEDDDEDDYYMEDFYPDEE